MTLRDAVGLTMSSAIVRGTGMQDLNDPRTPVVVGAPEIVRLYAANDTDANAYCLIEVDMGGHDREERIRLLSAKRTAGRIFGAYEAKPVETLDLPVLPWGPGNNQFYCCIRAHSSLEVEIDAIFVSGAPQAPILRQGPYATGAPLEWDNRDVVGAPFAGPTVAGPRRAAVVAGAAPTTP